MQRIAVVEFDDDRTNPLQPRRRVTEKPPLRTLDIHFEEIDLLHTAILKNFFKSKTGAGPTGPWPLNRPAPATPGGVVECCLSRTIADGRFDPFSPASEPRQIATQHSRVPRVRLDADILRRGE